MTDVLQLHQLLLTLQLSSTSTHLSPEYDHILEIIFTSHSHQVHATISIKVSRSSADEDTVIRTGTLERLDVVPKTEIS